MAYVYVLFKPIFQIVIMFYLFFASSYNSNCAIIEVHLNSIYVLMI